MPVFRKYYRTWKRNQDIFQIKNVIFYSQNERSLLKLSQRKKVRTLQIITFSHCFTVPGVWQSWKLFELRETHYSKTTTHITYCPNTSAKSENSWSRSVSWPHRSDVRLATIVAHKLLPRSAKTRTSSERHMQK